MIRLDSLFMNSRYIILVGDSFFVAVFILESLKRIFMAKLLIELGLVASQLVMERETKSLKMPEKKTTKKQKQKTATTDQ